MIGRIISVVVHLALIIVCIIIGTMIFNRIQPTEYGSLHLKIAVSDPITSVDVVVFNVKDGSRYRVDRTRIDGTISPSKDFFIRIYMIPKGEDRCVEISAITINQSRQRCDVAFGHWEPTYMLAQITKEYISLTHGHEEFSD